MFGASFDRNSSPCNRFHSQPMWSRRNTVAEYDWCWPPPPEQSESIRLFACPIDTVRFHLGLKHIQKLCHEFKLLFWVYNSNNKILPRPCQMCSWNASLILRIISVSSNKNVSLAFGDTIHRWIHLSERIDTSQSTAPFRSAQAFTNFCSLKRICRR